MNPSNDIRSKGRNAAFTCGPVHHASDLCWTVARPIGTQFGRGVGEDLELRTCGKCGTTIARPINDSDGKAT